MIVYAVDLGTTNVKVARYDAQGRLCALRRTPVTYRREAERVEFDPDAVFDGVVESIRACAVDAGAHAADDAVIVVTGQAESLVLAGADGRAIAPGISWMDERSDAEAREIAERFDRATAFAITGEPEAVPTWPATKLRWLSRHEPDVLAAARHVLMLKDYVLLRLTGRAVGEETTRGFTYLYDVPGRRYWDEMAEFCGVRPDTLPELVPAGADIGPVTAEAALELPAARGYRVNAGALDHFCAMLGTDGYRPGVVSASAGTVLSLSLLAERTPVDPAMAVSFHAGLQPDDTVLFACADSGGVSLEWLRDGILGGVPYAALESELPRREPRTAPLFLPYLTGVNPPDFDPHARGAFLDLQLRHDGVDLALAVMEGVAHLLRRNLDDLAAHGQRIERVVSSGGGTASAFWNQLKADATGLALHVPDEAEATCRGAAVLALAQAGEIASLHDTSGLAAPAETVYEPRSDPRFEDRYRAFDRALTRLFGP